MTDARVVKTKQKLYRAMGELLEKKSFDEITVIDLAQQAHTTRKTFYSHYQDKIELIEEYENQIFIKLSDLQAGYKFMDKAYITTYFRHIGNQDLLLKGLLSYNGSLEMQNLFKEGMYQEAQKLLALKIRDKTKLNYAALIFANGLFGVTQYWLMNGKKEKPEKMADIIIHLGMLPGAIFEENHRDLS
ncbi:TetR/AcrR family transcriptional regulator [Lactobacillus jensenii]|uniref:TetR/AcrR family transcriptional regulator n=1 Tax=Lactobacillus jensenii TaxID=109790 RepID=UPI001F08E798|nr:TetR/AcrR family transcriptional regulator [Lactobacillus jensenii]